MHVLLLVAAENVVTDRQTDRQNDKTTTVTLAAHERRGLINIATMCLLLIVSGDILSCEIIIISAKLCKASLPETWLLFSSFPTPILASCPNNNYCL